MIGRILTILLVILFAGASVQAQGIKRVPKKKDSTKTEAVQKNEQPSDKQKAVSGKPEISQPKDKDEFIDRNGDGINDKMNQAKPPAIKKQEPPKPKPQQPKRIQPSPSKPKEKPSEEPKKDSGKKKSKR